MNTESNYSRGWGIFEFVIFLIIIVVIVFFVMQWFYNRNLFSPSDNMKPPEGITYRDIYIGVKTESVRRIKTKDEDHINM